MQGLLTDEEQALSYNLLEVQDPTIFISLALRGKFLVLTFLALLLDLFTNSLTVLSQDMECLLHSALCRIFALK